VDLEVVDFCLTGPIMQNDYYTPDGALFVLAAGDIGYEI